MVRDLSEPSSDHPPAVEMLALGLTSDDKGGEGLIDGLGGGEDDTLTTDSVSSSGHFSSTETASMSETEDIYDPNSETIADTHTRLSAQFFLSSSHTNSIRQLTLTPHSIQTRVLHKHQ